MTEQIITTEKTSTVNDFISLTNGAAAVDFSPAFKKSVDKHYPGLLSEIEKSGYVNGAKFYKIYLRHADVNGKNIKFAFFKNLSPADKISKLPAAKKSGRDILTTIPKIFKSLLGLHRVVFTITITNRGNDFRTLHVNVNH